jgi:hypothetical protein
MSSTKKRGALRVATPVRRITIAHKFASGEIIHDDINDLVEREVSKRVGQHLEHTAVLVAKLQDRKGGRPRTSGMPNDGDIMFAYLAFKRAQPSMDDNALRRALVKRYAELLDQQRGDAIPIRTIERCVAAALPPRSDRPKPASSGHKKAHAIKPAKRKAKSTPK